MTDTEKVLVTGVAGYIGSHIAAALLRHGYSVVGVDNLSTGDRRLVPGAVEFVRMDIKSKRFEQLLLEKQIESVIHCAAYVDVAESMQHPLKYHENNVGRTIQLARSCVEARVKQIVFSSTAAVYGNPPTIPVSETEECLRPESPYGESKLMAENMLSQIGATSLFRVLTLRYFNVAGVGSTGYPSKKEPTHLIRRAVWTALGRFDEMQIFGMDYDTADGSPVRDFIHVEDLAEVHVAALRHLQKTGESDVFNCGYGRGISASDVVNAVQRISGTDMKVVFADRRPGDLPIVVADVSKLSKALSWEPPSDRFDAIIRSELEYAQKLFAS